MKKFKFTIRGQEYDVVIKDVDESVVEMEVNGTQHKVEIKREVPVTKTPILTRPAIETHKELKKKESNSATSVKSPLPGNIMQVYVKEGDQIKKGDKLLMYEAMKMENVILAETEGTVKSIKVQAGDVVQQDDVLLEIN